MSTTNVRAGNPVSNQIPTNLRAAGSPDYGYSRSMATFYTIEREIGRGANGIVSEVTHTRSGRKFACKSVPKRPAAIAQDAAKLAAHKTNVEREIWVMNELKSCLNVARLEQVFEDDEAIHIVQVCCLCSACSSVVISVCRCVKERPTV